jgi:HTH-type transcriptional regulator, sugar sensing transcriptional regulator
MLKELQDMGLSEKEAKVYLASLEIGRATADQLAKQAKIVRSTTYVQLESLMKKGLVSTYEEGKKTYFAPESPEYLKRLLELKKSEFEAKEKELGDFLPELLRKFEGAGERPVVRFFDGKEGVAIMRENLLDLPINTELKFIYNHDALAHVFSEQERFSYAKKRAATGIKLKSIYTRKEGPFAAEDIVPNTERRYIPYEKMPITSDFYIYNNTIAILALQKRIFAAVIESEEIAQSLGIIFSLLWEIGQKE